MGSKIRGKKLLSWLNGRRIFIGAVIVAVIAVVVVGLWVAGSPNNARDQQFDERRANHLQGIASGVESYYRKFGRLPSQLEELIQAEAYIESLSDPKTGAPYEYRQLAERQYELCANFDREALESPPYAAKPVFYGVMPEFFRHAAGRACFPITIQPLLLGTACGAGLPQCAAGQTCIVAIGTKSAPVCVPQNQECLAAGCPADCQLLESYPVQVVCSSSQPERPSTPANDCTLMRNEKSGAVNCFGCANDICKDPPVGFMTYDPNVGQDRIGIPYACYVGPTGCELAQ